MQLLFANRNTSCSTVHANSMPADHSARLMPVARTENSRRAVRFLPIRVRHIGFDADLLGKPANATLLT